jgi:hypothetical protein
MHLQFRHLIGEENRFKKRKNIPPPFLSSGIILNLISRQCKATEGQKMHTELHMERIEWLVFIMNPILAHK